MARQSEFDPVAAVMACDEGSSPAHVDSLKGRFSCVKRGECLHICEGNYWFSVDLWSEAHVRLWRLYLKLSSSST